MIKWILENLGIVIVAVVFLSQIVRGLLRATRSEAGRKELRREQGPDERRVREVQEQIRRQIEARRALHAPTAMPPVLSRESEAAPAPRAETTQLPEPFGGPLGRMLEELQRRAQQLQEPPPPPPPVVVQRQHAQHVAEVERQEQLAEEMRVLDETRHLVERRAAHLAADKRAEAEAEPALRSDARRRLLADLSDRQGLRRAFVLREVLGTPVGMR